MKEYKVFYETREVQYAIIEANSEEEAENLAESNFGEYQWEYCDGSLNGEILIDETELYDE